MAYDAIVVGAGPAGAATAALLGRRGFRVLLLDKARFPRDKVCGEGLMPAGVAILREMGLMGRLECGRAFRGIRFRLGEDRRFELDFSELMPSLRGWAFPRLALDGALAGFAARCRRVDFRPETLVRRVEIDARGVWVSDGRRSYSGRVLVGADGIRSRLFRRSAIERVPVRFDRLGLRARFDRYQGDPWLVEVHCGRLGEAYVAPQPDGGALVTMLLEKPGRPLRGAFQMLLGHFPVLRRHIPRSCLPGPVQAAAPLGLRLSRSHANRLLLAGDAGGAVDPVTGQGMTIALRDARLAAEVLGGRLQSGRLSRDDLGEYSRRREEYFRPQFDLAQGLLAALRRPLLARNAMRSLNNNAPLRRKILALTADLEANPPIAWTDKLRLACGV